MSANRDSLHSTAFPELPLRRLAHFVISLFLGILTVFLVATISNKRQEKELRDEVELETIYIDSFLKKTFPELKDEALVDAFIRFASEVKRDKWVVARRVVAGRPDYEHHNDGHLQHEASTDKYMLTYRVENSDLDIFLKQEYFDVRVTELAPMAVIPGIIVMVISLGAQIVYSDKKHHADAMQKQYEVETSTLTEALKEQEALALLGRMVAALAHEFKTPVATISNLIQALPARSSDKAFIDRFVVLAKKELGRSQQLIDNLLIYGKDIVTLNEEWIDLSTFVRELAVPLKYIRVVCADAKLLGDRFYLRVLFENILKNSLLAGATSINITVVAGDGDVAEIRCEDNGAGFPKNTDITQLTRPFVTSRSSGAGLGLYLVRKIAASHHGSVALAAKEKGALVTLIFPSERVKFNG